MSSRKLYAILVAAVGVFAGFSMGCASTRIRELSGNEFMTQASEIERINSFHWTSYVGVSEGRAYLEYGQPAYIGKGTRTIVYWVRLSELPDETANKLKAGDLPWKLWHATKVGDEEVK